MRAEPQGEQTEEHAVLEKSSTAGVQGGSLFGQPTQQRVGDRWSIAITNTIAVDVDLVVVARSRSRSGILVVIEVIEL